MVAPVASAAIAPSGAPAPFVSAQPKPRVLFALTGGRGSWRPIPGHRRDYTLRLTGVTPQLTWFTDRPVRDSGALPTQDLLRLWATAGLDGDPPNIAVVVRARDGSVTTTVGTLTSPTVSPAGTFSGVVHVLTKAEVMQVGGYLVEHAARHKPSVPAHFVDAALFIDDIKLSTNFFPAVNSSLTGGNGGLYFGGATA